MRRIAYAISGALGPGHCALSQGVHLCYAKASSDNPREIIALSQCVKAFTQVCIQFHDWSDCNSWQTLGGSLCS